MTEMLGWVVVLAVTSGLVAAPQVRRRVAPWSAGAVAWLRTSWADYRELRERQGLRQRPWNEELLHWSFDGCGWELHGHLPPPPGRSRSTTRTGWCPAVRTARPAPDHEEA